MKTCTNIVLWAGLALLASACSSGSSHSGAKSSAAAKRSTPNSSFQAGPNPCRLLTPRDISTALHQRMTKTVGSRSTCTYVNARRTDDVSITTAQMSVSGAEQAVASTARTVKVKVTRLHGIGDSAIAYLTTTKTRSVATSLVARNGTFVFLLVGSPNARPLMREAVSLARRAAKRA